MGHSHTNTHKFKSLKKAGSSRYIFRNEIDSTYFQDDIAYVDFKDLPRRTVCDKLLPDKAFEIAKNIKYDEYQPGLASVVYKFFDKTAGDTITHSEKEISENQKLVNGLHKSFNRKFENYNYFIEIKFWVQIFQRCS